MHRRDYDTSQTIQIKRQCWSKEVCHSMKPFDPKRFDRPISFKRIQPSYANVANPYNHQSGSITVLYFSIETTFSNLKHAKSQSILTT